VDCPICAASGRHCLCTNKLRNRLLGIESSLSFNSFDQYREFSTCSNTQSLRGHVFSEEQWSTRPDRILTQLRVGKHCAHLVETIQLAIQIFAPDYTFRSDLLFFGKETDNPEPTAFQRVAIQPAPDLKQVILPDPELTCPICNETFQRRAGLESHHSNIHLGLRPFQCSICAKEFGVKSNLRRHLKEVHKETSF